MYYSKQSQIVENTGEVTLPTGPAQADNDVDNTKRQREQSALTSTWELHQGKVQYAIPSLGWHRVALANGNGVITASGGGPISAWGAKSDNTYSPGAQVVVAVDRITNSAVIISQLPTVRTDPQQQFVQPTFVGSWSDISKDVVAGIYMKAADAGGAQSIENGLPSDHTDTDWRVFGSLGTQAFVSALEAGVTADDVTGLWVNLLDQSVELSGRQLSVEADGLTLLSDLDAKFSKLQLGGSLTYHADPQLIDNESDLSTMREKDTAFRFEFDQELPPVELYSYNLYCLTGSAASHIVGPYLTTADGDVLRMGQGGCVSYPSLSIIEHPPGKDDDQSEWYPNPSADHEARQQLAEQLADWEKSQDRLHFTRLVSAVAKIGSEWLVGPSHYIRHAAQEGSEGESIVEPFRESESVQFVSPPVEGEEDRTDPVFRGKRLESGSLKAGWVMDQAEDGSLFIGNEHGAGIRVSGTGVFIEGGSVRIAATKDVNILSRDLNVLTNRDVNLTAREHARVYSDKNVAITGGISGKGGVLIDSRGSNRKVELPKNAQDAVFSGVAIRSVNSQVVLYGGDVVAAAGASGTGQLVLRSDGGNMLLATGHKCVTHSNGILQTFGSEASPSQANFINGTQAIYQGDLSVNNGWFGGSVSAASHIQSFRGRVADSKGGQMGKIRETATFEKGIKSFESTRSQARQDWVTNAKALKAKLTDDSGPLSKKAKEQLSSGFVDESQSGSHYGVGSIQPTYMSVYQSTWGIPLTPLKSQQISYKQGSTSQSQTNSWPGRTSAIEVEMPIGVQSLSSRVDSMLSGISQPIETEKVSFESVFRTLSDE